MFCAICYQHYHTFSLFRILGYYYITRKKPIHCWVAKTLFGQGVYVYSTFIEDVVLNTYLMSKNYQITFIQN